MLIKKNSDFVLSVSLSLFNYDEFWMKRALFFANKAYSFNEVPVGAVLVIDNFEVGSGFNFTISDSDSFSHAEINCLRNSSFFISNHRFMKSTIYVTLEPCLMCLGAIFEHKIKRVVFAAYNGIYNKSSFTLFNYKSYFRNISFTGGILKIESNVLLKRFFLNKRLINNMS